MSTSFHPRNIHQHGYDFSLLKRVTPTLAQYVQSAPIRHGEAVRDTIDFSDPMAVRELNTALLKANYHINQWSIPNGALCPPIPGRVDYIHHVADLLDDTAEQSSKSGLNQNLTQPRRLLDIGTGANGVYLLLASQIYQWQCVGSDIRQASLDNVSQILESNPVLKQRIDLRLQGSPHQFFKDIIQPGEYFDISVCNPPFHASQQEAMSANTKKVANLNRSKGAKADCQLNHSPNLNFGGFENELWCNGGEKLFLKKMIKESREYSQQCGWFTSLISREEHVAPCIKVANKQGAAETKVIKMAQGNKISRLFAWRF
jgi:23S rRNA (adenine1618-N6)-methyltransferase